VEKLWKMQWHIKKFKSFPKANKIKLRKSTKHMELNLLQNRITPVFTPHEDLQKSEKIKRIKVIYMQLLRYIYIYIFFFFLL